MNVTRLPGVKAVAINAITIANYIRTAPRKREYRLSKIVTAIGMRKQRVYSET